MRTILSTLCSLLFLSAPAAAQQMTPAQRAAGVSRSRELAACLDGAHNEMQRMMRLIVAAERQRDTSTDPAARRDAEAAIEALLVRVEGVQRGARECLGTRVPTPAVPVTVQDAPPDPAADSVAGTQGSIPLVERDADLATYIRVVIGQQVDGQGQLDDHVVRSAVRRATGRLERCYEQYLDRGSMEPRTLDLVFSFRSSGAARRVTVENSQFGDRPFERCVQSAGGHIQASRGPRGGEAEFSYRLRFGRAPR